MTMNDLKGAFSAKLAGFSSPLDEILHTDDQTINMSQSVSDLTSHAIGKTIGNIISEEEVAIEMNVSFAKALSSAKKIEKFYLQQGISQPAKKLVAKLFSFTWTMGQFLCKMVHYLQGVSAICSVLTLTAMSMERYYAIVHPMKAKYVCTMSQAKKIICAIWGASFILGLPIVFVQIQLPVGVKHKAFWCVRNWDSWMWKAHEVYMFVLILVFPTIVMVLAYTCICWEICRVIQRRSYMTSGKATLHSENYPLSSKHVVFKPKMKLDENSTTIKQVIKMLVAVIVVFVVCWGPMLVDNLLSAFGAMNPLRTGPLKHMSTAFHLMAYFNSCVNPIVYGFMSRSFRDSFSKALCCGGRSPRRQLSVSHTRTTSLRNQDSRLYIN